jgi:hypothetical protein
VDDARIEFVYLPSHIDLGRRVRHRRAAAAGDPVLGLDLDWPARVAEVAPHFVAYSSTKEQEFVAFQSCR